MREDGEHPDVSSPEPWYKDHHPVAMACSHPRPPAGLDATTSNTTRRASLCNRMRSAMARPWLGLLVAAVVVAVAASAPAGQQQFLESNDTAWHKYVRAPPQKKVAPARILSQYTVGNVTNPGGLVSSGSGSSPTVFSRLTADDVVPTLVIDFGLNVAGLLSIDFAGSHNTSAGFPGISLAFSETLQYLTDRSDFTRSDNAGGVSVFPRSRRIIKRPLSKAETDHEPSII